MKSPHCPSCGKSHWSTQRCGARDVLDERPLAVQLSQKQDAAPRPKPKIDKRFSKRLPMKVHRESSSPLEDAPVSGEEKAVATGPLGATPLDGQAVHGADPPLTPAAKQKKYREKRGDAYREANKLRMRKKRDG